MSTIVHWISGEYSNKNQGSYRILCKGAPETIE